MTALQTTPRRALQSTSHAIHRLERTNQELRGLSDTLRSYVCEPKTYTLFERFESLKRRLDNLRSGNQELIAAMKGQKQALGDQVEQFRNRIKEFQELERSVLEYIGMAKMHC
ncbi:hypothetical protein [Zeaxanthinibacter enoshimensis]|uniref:Uncharacterized protein n=1 Tax=Zeaxanthinibacter enoshimensis TaxID=392009 RepID=A0A4R6TL03_9FLAO|nr:hypothetical protein [Zeaxanthinibacter enoshimensis]TDQ31357.1 hypothetical protein CLV82_2065 [Zeaxanthinibacter enoshimensis]